MNLTNAQIEENKHCIETLLASTHRQGIGRVIQYLNKVGFFEAPSSLHGHHNWRGGLAQHSLGVYYWAVRKNGGKTENAIVIAALLHDICKGKPFYIDHNGRPAQREVHYKGHGKRSIFLLRQQGLQLSPQERRAIRWHMGGHYAQSAEDILDIQIAKREPLYQLVHQADHQDAGHQHLMPCPSIQIKEAFQMRLFHA